MFPTQKPVVLLHRTGKAPESSVPRPRLNKKRCGSVEASDMGQRAGNTYIRSARQAHPCQRTRTLAPSNDSTSEPMLGTPPPLHDEDSNINDTPTKGEEAQRSEEWDSKICGRGRLESLLVGTWRIRHTHARAPLHLPLSKTLHISAAICRLDASSARSNVCIVACAQAYACHELVSSGRMKGLRQVGWCLERTQQYGLAIGCERIGHVARTLCTWQKPLL